ncbi:MAG: hypothetical protein IKL99_03510, partial [Oscillospiraceae bacterium]|nr:hypothetical protein [Oscillospiraceae bacterium]
AQVSRRACGVQVFAKQNLAAGRIHFARGRWMERVPAKAQLLWESQKEDAQSRHGAGADGGISGCSQAGRRLIFTTRRMLLHPPCFLFFFPIICPYCPFCALFDNFNEKFVHCAVALRTAEAYNV